MDGGVRDPNNPARVPPILAAIDQPQEGLPRVIHPVGLVVGRPDPAASAQGVMSMYAGNVEITEDMTVTDASGTPFRFKKGDRVSAARAAAFPDLAKRIEGPIMGADEARAVYGAPENRMRGPAPENRGGRTVTSEDLSGKSLTALRQLAKDAGIEGRTGMDHDQLVAALSGPASSATGDAAPESELARGNEGTDTEGPLGAGHSSAVGVPSQAG